jgi:hypothetical protein
LLNSFGSEIFEAFKTVLVCNAGVIAGLSEELLDLFLNIYLLCNGCEHHTAGGGGPDQAALNIIINSKIYREIILTPNSRMAWAAQLGTTGPQVFGLNKEFLTDLVPIMKDGLVCNALGQPYVIVHQYDRVPGWRDQIKSKYN